MRMSMTETDSSRLKHAKYINISIWCLILLLFSLTPLAPVANIAQLQRVWPGQGHVSGVCSESATWSQRCLSGPGTHNMLAGWQEWFCEGKPRGWKSGWCNLGQTQKVVPFVFPSPFVTVPDLPVCSCLDSSLWNKLLMVQNHKCDVTFKGISCKQWQFPHSYLVWWIKGNQLPCTVLCPVIYALCRRNGNRKKTQIYIEWRLAIEEENMYNKRNHSLYILKATAYILIEFSLLWLHQV